MHLHRQWSFLTAFDVFSEPPACEPLCEELDELVCMVAMGYPTAALTALDSGEG